MHNETINGTSNDVNALDSLQLDPRSLTRSQLRALLGSRTTVPVPFAGACCGISRSASYAAARDGSLKTLRLGHRLLVPTTWLEAELGLDAGEEAGCSCAGCGCRE